MFSQQQKLNFDSKQETIESYWYLPVTELLKRLRSSTAGLTIAEASERSIFWSELKSKHQNLIHSTELVVTVLSLNRLGPF
jgi:hypothetical protein